MKRCEFSTMMQVLYNHGTAMGRVNQRVLVEGMFDSYLNAKSNRGVFDSSVVSRWINGERPVSKNVCAYYSTDHARDCLIGDIQIGILPLVADMYTVEEILIEIIREDRGISAGKKRELLEPALRGDMAEFLADLIIFVINRPEERLR